MRAYAIPLVLIHSVLSGCSGGGGSGSRSSRIAGRVEGENGAGLPGIQVVLNDSTVTTTDSTGLYGFAEVRRGHHIVSVNSPSEVLVFAPPSYEIELDAPREDIDFIAKVEVGLDATIVSSGEVILPDESGLEESELTVVTAVGAAKLNVNGHFAGLEFLERQGAQVVAVEHENGSPVMVAYVRSEVIKSGEVTLSSREAALGLIYVNPYVLVLPASVRTLIEMLQDKDAKRSERVMNALLQMKKIDIEGLKKAYK